MSLNVYISYGTAVEQVTALRLQALATVNGLAVYVPPASTRTDSGPARELDPSSVRQLAESDVVLGVTTIGLSEACRLELNYGPNLGKRTIILAGPTLAQSFIPQFPGSVVTVDPQNPGAAEQEIVRYLSEFRLQKESSQALLALGTVALGLLIFAPQKT